MRNLKFKIDGQKLSKNGDFSNIVKGTRNYLKCCFDFCDSDWVGCKAVVVFENDNNTYTVPMVNGECLVPDDITDSAHFKIRIVGKKDDCKIVTNKILISQEG